MANQWLELYKKQHAEFQWTAEFLRGVAYILKPRVVEVIDAKYSLGYMGRTSGSVVLVLQDTKYPSKELMSFLFACKNGMTSWTCILRKHIGINEVEYFELDGLQYITTGLGSEPDTIKLSFYYNLIQHYVCA